MIVIGLSDDCNYSSQDSSDCGGDDSRDNSRDDILDSREICKQVGHQCKGKGCAKWLPLMLLLRLQRIQLIWHLRAFRRH
jgi:hypothetical protein